jgi:hypothetical protein
MWIFPNWAFSFHSKNYLLCDISPSAFSALYFAIWYRLKSLQSLLPLVNAFLLITIQKGAVPKVQLANSGVDFIKVGHTA